MSATTLTRDQQIREILKCGKDPVYFIKTYCKIQHPIRGTILFDTYPFQEDCIRDFLEHRFNIILKSRQLGLSTISAAYAVWMAIFQKDRNILVIATKLPTAQNFIKKVAVMLHCLPKWLLLPKFEPTKAQITFNNGSQIKAVPTSDDAGRSEALSLLIVDEAAFIRDFDEIWTGLSPTISTGGRAIILSTPNGVGGQYYKLWTDAQSGNTTGRTRFNPVKLPWTVHPEHDETWFHEETRNLTKRQISQEYLCDFTSSGDTFLQPDSLDYVRATIKQPIEKAGLKNDIWIWSQPIPGRQYVISSDVSRGDARDFSAFHIMDTENCEVVVEYMGKMPPEKLALVIEEWGRKYNNALAAVEQNSFGYFVNTYLREKAYPSLYYNGVDDPFGYVPNDPQALPGFLTNPKNRTQILSKLEEMIRSKGLRTYSQRLYDQLQAFVWNGNKPMASKDSYDDLVISVAIATWLSHGSTGASQQQMKMAMAMLAATGTAQTRSSTGAFDSINSVQPLVNPQIRGFNPREAYRPRDPASVRHVDVSDFSWLMK